MTRKRRLRPALALVAVAGVAGACGSAALAVAGGTGSAMHTVKHGRAARIADGRVLRLAAPGRHLPPAPAPAASRSKLGSANAPGKSLPGLPARASGPAAALAPSPNRVLPSIGASSVPSTPTPTGAPALSLPSR